METMRKEELQITESFQTANRLGELAHARDDISEANYQYGRASAFEEILSTIQQTGT